MYPSLTNYRANKATVAQLEKSIARARELLPEIIEDKSASITRVYNETNRHKEGSYSDSTGELATVEVTRDAEKLMSDIRGMLIQKNRVQTWIDEAEAALAFLHKDERIVVQLRAIYRKTWEEIEYDFEIKTEKHFSIKTLRKNYNNAIKKIEPFFSSCETSE